MLACSTRWPSAAAGCSPGRSTSGWPSSGWPDSESTGSPPATRDCSSERQMPDGLSELVSPPEAGRVFEQPARAGFADCAPSGRMRLDGLARWLQDVAYADVEDAGLADLAVWVVRRTRIQVRRFPRFGERHQLATFCSGLGRMWGER